MCFIVRLCVSEGCGKDKFLLYAQCLDKCPANFFATFRNLTFPTQNGTTLTYTANFCEQCHSNCSLCFGKGPDDCSACAKGFILTNSTCIKTQEKSTGITQTQIILGIVVLTFCVFAIIIACFCFGIESACRNMCYRTNPYGAVLSDDSAEVGGNKRLLDDLSDSEEDCYSKQTVYLDRPNGNVAHFSPIRVNGYHQSNL